MLQLLRPTPLVVCAVLLVVLTSWLEWPRMARMLRRVRILLLAILIVYGYSTPGLYLWSGWGAPTREGLWAGGAQALRLLAVLSALQWLLRGMDRNRLFAGVHVLAAPLRALGVDRQRWALRLALTMDQAEALLAERQDWRGLWRQLNALDQSAAHGPAGGTAAGAPIATVVTLPQVRLATAQRGLLIGLLSGIVLTFVFFSSVYA